MVVSGGIRVRAKEGGKEGVRQTGRSLDAGEKGRDCRVLSVSYSYQGSPCRTYQAPHQKRNGSDGQTVTISIFVSALHGIMIWPAWHNMANIK